MTAPLFRKILVANDGSEGAMKALSVGGDLARRSGAELHAVTVRERVAHHSLTVVGGAARGSADADDYLRLQGIRAGMVAMDHGVRLKSHLLIGHEVETLVTFIREQGFDLLVVGFRGHSRGFGDHWGGTSHSLARLAPCAVLVVK
jgi:nucleotide-binding universal stress UspA family protein